MTAFQSVLQPFQPNSSFVQVSQDRWLQLYIDATSLSAYKTCPRYYQLTIVTGWTPRRENIHFWFGIELHRAVEEYHRLRAQATPHTDALRTTIRDLLHRTWDYERKRPIYHDDPNKNRFTLVRTAVQYLDLYGPSDRLKTVILDSGEPAVELSAIFDSGIHSALAGTNFTFVVKPDRLARLGDDYYFSDIKSTKGTISPSWFETFTPDNQFSMYTYAGQVVYEKPVRGVVVDGAQTAVNFTRFDREIITRSEQQIASWLNSTRWWLQNLESCVTEFGSDWWPENESSCFGCHFRHICSMAPQSRQPWLKADFTQRVWDPLKLRSV